VLTLALLLRHPCCAADMLAMPLCWTVEIVRAGGWLLPWVPCSTAEAAIVMQGVP